MHFFELNRVFPDPAFNNNIFSKKKKKSTREVLEAACSEVRLGINPGLDYKDAFILHLHVYSGILFILRDKTEHLTYCSKCAG